MLEEYERNFIPCFVWVFGIIDLQIEKEEIQN